MEDDSYVKNRRAQLKKFFENRTLPVKEKSYLSQLIGGTGSFGAKAARRLEKTYGMGEYFLERQDDVGAPPSLAVAPESLEVQAARLLAEMPDYLADAWFSRVKGHADTLRAEKRAAQEAGRPQGDDRRENISPHDQASERRRTSN